MRITLFAHGSRGDIWPMVALGWHLAQHRHEVTVAVPDEFKAFTEDVGLATAQLPFDGMAWLASEEGQRLLHTGGVEYARAVGREYDRRAEEFDDASLAAAEGADALVGSILTAMRTLVPGELLRVPIAMVHQVPVAPSREYSSLLTRGRLRSRTLRRASHGLTHLLWERGAADATRAFRRKLGLSEERMGIFRRLEEMRCLGLHTVSPSLFPRPSDWGEHLKITGAWQMPAAARGELEEGLPAELQEWLDAGPPPVFLGFGSMPVLDPAPLFEDILTVTAALDQRAVLSANCLPPGAADALPERLCVVGAVDHDLLFERCAAVVHHGGIGSTIASMRAGRPTMVCSVLADQPWWGERLRRLGVGEHIPFRKLTRERLKARLRTLLAPALAERAGRLGAAIKAEGDGLPEATRLLEEHLLDAMPPQPGRHRAPRRGLSAAPPADVSVRG